MPNFRISTVYANKAHVLHVQLVQENLHSGAFHKVSVIASEDLYWKTVRKLTWLA